jgi:hypothetical protein
MRIQVIRKWYSQISTIGVISVDGVKCGFTLEDVARAEGVKIPNHTAIPAGEYEVVNDYSERFKKIMPHILDVKNFEGVRIHKGNRTSDTTGCLICGLQKGQDLVYNCDPTYDYIFHSIDQAMKRKEKVTITIINEQE